ncbi:putative death-receptor fusion protein-domain-containing protein [Hypoxylon trugodes]|uniref:putative death-receptor fusion protein-domain-containing protein n=1 Tax=Hypoxylon trugodes TaxID=326681 RepID=UPI00218D5661|nr:putative death-receptor fusion protein-domain-containing protein [Hypoxylon trugodes]KAI1393468.1 putative death-receptor fusion protein-domain-containing protein [Hypoxylon trugodes]
MESSVLAKVSETDFNPRVAVSWLEEQPEESQLWKAMFEELLVSAAKPKQSSGNACVKLYGFVEQCSKSTNLALRTFAFAESTALRLFDFFMEWNEQDPHRSMKLVVDFLTYFISKNPTPEVGASVKETILNITVSTITEQSSRPSIKSAMVSLDYFIQKKLVSPYEILEIYRRIHNLPSDESILWDTFIAKIFTWMELHYVCNVAGKFLVTIFTSSWSTDEDIRHRPENWHKFIYNGLQMNVDYLESIKRYIFVPLFKTDQTASLAYLRHLSSLQKLTSNDSSSWDLNSMLWLGMLEAGKKVGVVGEPGSDNDDSASQLRADVLESVLCHESREARSSAVSILIASPSTTKPYTAEALELLKKHLPSFHEDSDPMMRYDILGHSKNMIKRIQSTVESLRREDEKLSKKADKTGSNKTTTKPATKVKKNQSYVAGDLRDTLRLHEDFVSWYVGFLKGELAPTTSYQRHITALKAMVFIVKPGQFGNGVTSSSNLRGLLADSTWLRSILDLIMDPFDDVRDTAALLVMSLSSKDEDLELPLQMSGRGGTLLEELQSFGSRAHELARRTARADHSDGAARSSELLCHWSIGAKDQIRIPLEMLSSLEARITAAEKDLAAAVLEAPVHGDFASLRYIWGSLSDTKFSEEDMKVLAELQDRAITSCQRIWQTVRHVLCDDSPEGHLPEELEEVEGLDTKDLLSYSFRAIHESSNLMRTIASNARNNLDQKLLAPSRRNFEQIGRLTFDELSNLRHRGAFTTVSQTFTACCQLVKYFPGHSNNDSSLLDEWYQGALTCIHTQTSTTRRSAGIPALIVGILSSNADHPSFEDVIHTLQDIGRRPALVSQTDGSNLPQVHALNCTKDIFKSSYLSKRAESYLTDCLQLAANSLKSEVWAIRNCGLLLLRSLIDCLFGTSESKLSIEAGWDGRTVKISYHKFKALPALLVSLLEMGQNSSGVLIGSQTAESVFPALDIIRRAGPPEEFRDKLYDIIAWYLGSHIWHVRDIAARTLCSFLLKASWLESITTLLASSGASANKLHGVLLTIKALIERLAEVMPDQLSDSNVRVAYDLLIELPSTNSCINTCSEVKAVYIEVISFLAELNRKMETPGVDDTSSVSTLLRSWSFELAADYDKSKAPTALLEVRLGQVVIQQALQGSSTDTNNTLGSTLTAFLKNDANVNVACSMLENMSNEDLPQSYEARRNLINAYVQVCFETDTPEPRAIALENIATLIDKALLDKSDEGLSCLPEYEILVRLWADLHAKTMNPSLSDAIIRVSGPLLAIIILRSDGKAQDEQESWVRSWGAMMSDAGMAERTFDTRMAAVCAMRSFSTNTTNEFTTAASDPQHLPWLLALYDAINDDDDEVRATAASAAAPILSNQHLVSVEAGQRLLQWLAIHYSTADEFRAHVACRMIEHIPPSNYSNAISFLENWIPAEVQLKEAMRFDDSLFVIEEQNLYIDEVRETRRWRDVFESLPPSPSFSEPESTLHEWTLAGLITISRLVGSEARYGPLGWTSKPEVFAICARILISAAALVATGNSGSKDILDEMRQFRDEGRRVGIHGLLLGMCEGLIGL